MGHVRGYVLAVHAILDLFNCHLQVYRDQAAPVEDVFRAAGLLLDFEITAGIPETMPGLLAALKPYMQGK